MDITGRLTDGDKPSARVLAIAKRIGDEAIAWHEYEDGHVVIVFNQKGKQSFEPEKKLPNIIHTNKEAQAVVETLTPHLPPQPKKKGGSK